MALADVEYEQQEPCFKPLNEETMENYIQERIKHLKNACRKYLFEKEKFPESNISMRVFLNIRYEGTDTGIMSSPYNHDENVELNHFDFETAFLKRYQNEYGFTMPNRLLIVDDIRVRATAKTGIEPKIPLVKVRTSNIIEIACVKNIFFDESFVETNVYLTESLYTNDVIIGPAVIIDKNR
jgi:5-oxoprolinase (ATP-hydrolysing)